MAGSVRWRTDFDAAQRYVRFRTDAAEARPQHFRAPDQRRLDSKDSSVLHEFLAINRHQLIERCRLKSAHRSTRPVSELELAYGVPLFLDQIIETLQVEQTPEAPDTLRLRIGSGVCSTCRVSMI